MKILLAGASGAVGLPLIKILVEGGHEVYGITQSSKGADKILERRGKPIVLNVLEKEAVEAALSQLKPEIVIDMLTHLPQEYTPKAMQTAGPMDAKIRREGGANLQKAAELSQAKRYILQSSAFWYEPGEGLADESTPFAFEASPGVSQGCKTYAELERRVFSSDQLEGVAMRFGFFYGPGTWFYPQGNMGDQLRAQQFPIIGQGEGYWNFLHIEDAAIATALAVTSEPGRYNIVNDHPIQMRDWMPAFAKYVGAPVPPTISEAEGLKQLGADSVYYATKLRPASNAKAKKELRFKPRELEWISSRK